MFCKAIKMIIVVGIRIVPLSRLFERMGFISAMSLFWRLLIIKFFLFFLIQNFFGKIIIEMGAIVQFKDKNGNDWGSKDENRFVIIFSFFLVVGLVYCLVLG